MLVLVFVLLLASAVTSDGIATGTFTPVGSSFDSAWSRPTCMTMTCVLQQDGTVVTASSSCPLSAGSVINWPSSPASLVVAKQSSTQYVVDNTQTIASMSAACFVGATANTLSSNIVRAEALAAGNVLAGSVTTSAISFTPSASTSLTQSPLNVYYQASIPATVKLGAWSTTLTVGVIRVGSLVTLRVPNMWLDVEWAGGPYFQLILPVTPSSPIAMNGDAGTIIHINSANKWIPGSVFTVSSTSTVELRIYNGILDAAAWPANKASDWVYYGWHLWSISWTAA